MKALRFLACAAVAAVAGAVVAAVRSPKPEPVNHPTRSAARDIADVVGDRQPRRTNHGRWPS